MTSWENETPFDNVWLKINTSGSSKLFVNCIYIPGWASFDQVKLYYSQISFIVNEKVPYSRFLILGDFNLACIEWSQSTDRCLPIIYDGRQAEELIRTLQFSNLSQHNFIKKLERVINFS